MYNIHYWKVVKKLSFCGRKRPVHATPAQCHSRQDTKCLRNCNQSDQPYREVCVVASIAGPSQIKPGKARVTIVRRYNLNAVIWYTRESVCEHHLRPVAATSVVHSTVRIPGLSTDHPGYVLLDPTYNLSLLGQSTLVYDPQNGDWPRHKISCLLLGTQSYAKTMELQDASVVVSSHGCGWSPGDVVYEDWINDTYRV